MGSKRSLLALSIAAALSVAGAASSAQAGSERDDPGGYRIGPLGQVFGGSSEWGASGARSYGFAAPVHTRHHTKQTHAR
jgi:hypothetical protein